MLGLWCAASIIKIQIGRGAWFATRGLNAAITKVLVASVVTLAAVVAIDIWPKGCINM